MFQSKTGNQEVILKNSDLAIFFNHPVPLFLTILIPADIPFSVHYMYIYLSKSIYIFQYLSICIYSYIDILCQSFLILSSFRGAIYLFIYLSFYLSIYNILLSFSGSISKYSIKFKHFELI